MSGPWEAYQQKPESAQETGPWTAFQKPAAPTENSGLENFGLGLARAGRDLVDAPAYLLPAGIARGARAFGLNDLASWAEGQARGVSNLNREAEADYQAATPGSAAAGSARVLGNIATAFVPGMGQVKAAQAVDRLWKAGGALNTAKSLGVAAGTGAAQSAVLNTKTEDDSLLANAAMGALLSPAAQLAQAGGAGLVQLGRNALAGQAGRQGRMLAKAGQVDPAQLAAGIRAGNTEITPGSLPTTAQALENPGLSQLQRTVKNAAYNPITEREAAQNAARIAALDGIAPGATGLTSIEAAQNAGGLIRDQAGELRQVLKAAIRGAYNDPKLAHASLMAPDQDAVHAVVAQFYPGKAFDAAPIEMKRMVQRLTNGEQIQLKEFDALRKIVGNRAADLRDSDRTASAAFSAVKGLFDDAEESALTRSADKFMVTGQGPWGPEFGNLAGDGENWVAHLLRMGGGSVPAAGTHPFYGPIELAAGQPVRAGGSGVLHIDAHGRDEALRRIPGLMEDGTLYGRIEGRKLKPKGGDSGQLFLSDGEYEAVLKDHVNVPTGKESRRWVPTVYPMNPKMMIPLETGQSARASGFAHSALPSNGTNGFTSSIDDAGLARLLADADSAAAAARNPPPPAPLPRDPHQYVGGLLAPDQATQLEAARNLHRILKDRYETGPAADLWRTGADGLAVKDGAEIPRGFFGSQADQAARMEQFNKLSPGNPDTLGALQRYGIADLFERVTGPTGNLSYPKLGHWLDARSEAVPRLFNQDQQAVLGNLRSDLGRAFQAENLGRATGSNTAQNLLGDAVLDSRLASTLASLFPKVGPAGLDALRNAQRGRATQELGDAMTHPEVAANALDAFTRLLQPNAAQRTLGYIPRAVVPGSNALIGGER